MTETMSWSDTQRTIISEDMEEGSTSYRYTVDLSTTPWTVTIEKCAGYELIPTGKDAAGIETAVIGSRVSAQCETVRLVSRKVARRKQRAAAGN
jgi:hypothetical protein